MTLFLYTDIIWVIKKRRKSRLVNIYWTTTMESITEEKKKNNWFVKIWNYFTTYEKIWLFLLTTAGIVLAILFPGDETRTWVRIIECVTLVGGITCELLLSKQTRWAFVVSFLFYDLTQTVIYIVNGYYVNALYEIIFWIPILFVDFFAWNKMKDKENDDLTVVKKINWKLDLVLFFIILGVSLAIGALFTVISITAEGMSDYWWLDALGGALNVLNGLFILLRFREQWIPWIGVCLVEAVMWCISGRYVLLILSLGYLTNSIYGYIKWTKYIKTHPQSTKIEENSNNIADNDKPTNNGQTATVSK